MGSTPRTLTTGAAALLTAAAMSGCTSETDLTRADQSQIPTEELVGDAIP